MYKKYLKFKQRFIKEDEEEQKQKVVKVGNTFEVNVETDIKQLLQPDKLLCKFEHEHSVKWNTSELQMIKLFEIDLDQQDPFFIEGQDEIRD